MEPMGSILEHHTRYIKSMSFQRFYMDCKTYIVLKKRPGAAYTFHLNTIKRLQALPTRTATATLYLILGAITIIAEIHQIQLIEPRILHFYMYKYINLKCSIETGCIRIQTLSISYTCRSFLNSKQ